jgi:enoyl-CoA hydratase/carnithine racemase
MLLISDEDRVRTLTLNRAEALNAFSEALYDAAAEALIAAAHDSSIAVVVITGTGRAFSSGNDLIEMAQRTSGGFTNGEHGFTGFVQQLLDFPKPLLCAVNGLAVGIGATMLGFADLVFMSSLARVRCPFTNLGVVPEAASSYIFPQLMGRQNAMWTLLSSEWLTADECLEMGLAFAVCEPEALMATTMRHALVLASKPISSLVASKATVVSQWRDGIIAARRREDAQFSVLLGGAANVEALRAFAEKREPDFAAIDAAEG